MGYYPTKPRPNHRADPALEQYSRIRPNAARIWYLAPPVYRVHNLGRPMVAMIVFSFRNLLSSTGATTGVIQTEDINGGDIRICFTCQTAMGT
jgi:hypothetical protein